MENKEFLGEKLSMNLIIVIIVSLLGLGLFFFNYFVLNQEILNLIAIVLVVIGPIFLEYRRYSEQRGIEENFPDFLGDLSENIRAGMTLPQAIKSVKDNDYGALSPHVKKIAVQVDWGVSFEDVLNGLSKKGTPTLKRTIATIIESQKGGGKTAEIIDAVSKSVTEINKLKKERRSGLYSQMVTGYIIYFVFIGILIVLLKLLLPSLMFTVGSGVSTINPEDITSMYMNIFRWLVIIQGLFSGLAVGKMSEGSIIAGLKHSLIMVILGYSALILFI